MQLKKASLSYLANSAKVALPKYEPATLQNGILHIGVANFFRAHFANFLDELFATSEEDRKWGVIGAAVTDHSYSARRDALQEQDYLYTLVERDADSVDARVVGSINTLLPYKQDFGPILENLMNEDIKIVSTCITEGGYYLNPATGEFDPNHPEIQEDAENPDQPITIMGLFVKALKKRRDAGIAPFTVLCCDNVPYCGDVAKDGVTGLAKMSDPKLAEWIEENVSFPNSMVDRITPSTGEKEVEFLKEKFGHEDKVPVFCEPFCQWVLEDKFCDGRPALEKVGVQFVDDVTPWEFMKFRILNGGHASLCYPAALLGIEYVHEAMEHETIGPFLDALERTEIIPGVPPVPETDLGDYWENIQTRFKNPTLNDSIDRNCKDGSDRQPKFILPPVTDCLKDDRSVSGLALVSAMWCRYCLGTTEAGDEISPNDKIWDELKETAKKAKDNPQAWLDMEDIYGDTAKDERFADAFASALKMVNDKGVEAAMNKFVEEQKQASKQNERQAKVTA